MYYSPYLSHGSFPDENCPSQGRGYSLSLHTMLAQFYHFFLLLQWLEKGAARQNKIWVYEQSLSSYVPQILQHFILFTP